jgi:hypothetical protein
MDAFDGKRQGDSRRSVSPLLFIIPMAVVIMIGVLYFLTHHPLTSSESNSPVAITNQPHPLRRDLPALPTITPTSMAKPSNQTETVIANSTAAPEPSPSPSPATEATSVSVAFDLVNRDVMERMSQEGEGTLEIGRYSVSVVPQFKTKYDAVKSDTNFHSLTVETKSLTTSQPSLVFGGGKEPKTNDAIGFFVEITPTRMTERGMEYRTSIKRSLPELTTPTEVKVASQNFDDTLVIPMGSGVVIAGLLPRKNLAEGEDELYKNNILRALIDPEFQKGDSEFLIVLTLY